MVRKAQNITEDAVGEVQDETPHPAPTPSVQALCLKEGRERACRDRWKEGGQDPSPAPCSVWPSPHLLLHGESVRSGRSGAQCCPRGAGSACSICAQPGGGSLSTVPPAARGPRNFGGRGRGRGGASGGRGRGRGGVQRPPARACSSAVRSVAGWGCRGGAGEDPGRGWSCAPGMDGRTRAELK